MLKEEAKQFCLNTYSHGFKFIILPDRSLFERILWTIITAVSILAALSLALLTWTTVIKAPTMTLADTPNYPIWNYVFPAITICNFNKISKRRAFQVAEIYKKPQNMTVEDLAWSLRLLHHLTDPNFLDVLPHKNFSQLQDVLNYNDVVIEDLLQYLAPNCKEMMQKCTWKGQQTSCENLFEQIKTVNGFCCSFNYFALKNHSFGNTASLHLKSPKRPRRVAATGYQTALEAVINSLPEDYFATPFSSFGHKVTIHYPYNFPDGNALNMFQSTQGLIFISVKPTLYRTDIKVNNLSIKQRGCFYHKEKELIYFKYTYFNCISECRANITVELCGCLPFYYYYGNSNNDSYNSPKICDLEDILCLYKNKEKIQSSIPGYTSNSISYTEDWQEHIGNCPCLPDCTYSYYAVEGSAGEFSKQYVENRPTLYGGVKLMNQSVFRVFFEDLVSSKYTTSVKFYWHTILGLFGGVLGLFTGVSIVSIVEAIYFFTIRPILDLLVQYKTKQNRKKLESYKK